MNKLCSIEGCNRKHVARGYCGRHYMANKRHGDPNKIGTPKGAVQKFVLEASSYRGNECLIWPFAMGSVGYGKLAGHITEAHQAVCTLAHGPRPTKHHDASHSCGVRACVNPRHLRWATRKENLADMVRHGTKLEGEGAPWSKLTKAAVLAIRAMRGRTTQKALAKRFSVSPGTIRSIQQNKTWRSVL